MGFFEEIGDVAVVVKFLFEVKFPERLELKRKHGILGPDEGLLVLVGFGEVLKHQIYY